MANSADTKSDRRGGLEKLPSRCSSADKLLLPVGVASNTHGLFCFPVFPVLTQFLVRKRAMKGGEKGEGSGIFIWRYVCVFARVHVCMFCSSVLVIDLYCLFCVCVYVCVSVCVCVSV